MMTNIYLLKSYFFNWHWEHTFTMFYETNEHFIFAYIYEARLGHQRNDRRSKEESFSCYGHYYIHDTITP